MYVDHDAVKNMWQPKFLRYRTNLIIIISLFLTVFNGNKLDKEDAFWGTSGLGSQ